MTDDQYAQYESLEKSDDFQDVPENIDTASSVPDIATLALAMKNKINEIGVADGIGSRDNRGASINKGQLRQNLIRLIFKVSRGATAYYARTGDTFKQKNVDFEKSAFTNTAAPKLVHIANQLVTDTTADADNLVNADGDDLAALTILAKAFSDAIPKPKRAEEESKVNNAKIPPLLKEAKEIRRVLDIFMQTFIDSNPDFYAEWAETLTIDDAATSNPAAHTINLTVEAGQTANVDYAEFDMQNSSEIKLINNNATTIEYGFGSDTTTFAGEPELVNANSQQRKTATALGYQSIETNQLNIRNASGAALLITLEFYDMG